MLDTVKRYATWPIVALFLGSGALVTAVLIFGPPEAKAPLLAALGPIATFIALHLEPKAKA